VGSLFVGIAFQPFIFMLIALQIGATTYMRRIDKEQNWRPIGALAPAAVRPA
jgi:putative inorganic carbon (hco3(-)) transporter